MNQPSEASELETLRQELAELKTQQLQFETRIAALEKRKGKMPTVGSSPPNSPQGTSQPAPAANPKAPQAWEQWLGLRGFSWLGIFALISGLILFIRYAYLEGWLGPVATLGAGFLLALTLIISGETISRREPVRSWGNNLLGGGVALLYFEVYAAYHFDYFRQVTQLNALADCIGLMAVVGLAIGLALRKQSQTLASRAFVLGYVTSFFSTDFALLSFFYNGCLTLGLMTVAGVGRWPWLASVGLVGSWMLHGFWVLQNPSLSTWSLTLSLLYFGFYAGLNAWFQKTQTSGHLLANNLLNLLGYACLLVLAWPQATAWHLLASQLALLGLVLGLYGLGRFWQQNNTQEHGLQLLLASGALAAVLELHFSDSSALGLGFLGLGLLAVRLWRPPLPTQPPKGVSLLAIYEAVILSCGLRCLFLSTEAPWTGLLLSVGIALGLLAGRRLFQPWPGHGLWLLLASLLVLKGHWLGVAFPEAYAAEGVQWLPLLSDGLGLLILFSASVFMTRHLNQRQQHALLWPLWVILLSWLWQISPTGWVSVSWALAGALLMAIGFILSQAVVRYLGISLLLLTGAKIYFQDMAELDLGYRILSLVILGGVLLGMAFVYTRLAHAGKTEGDVS